jgi:hypothetical protein
LSIQAVFALVARVYSAIQTVLGIVGLIQGNTNKAAQENVPFSIDTATSEIKVTVLDASWGNQAISTKIDALSAYVTTQFADVLAAIAALPQVGDPVTLPTTPPAGYGAPTSVEIANGVWTDYVGSDLVTPWEYMKSLGSRSLFEKGYSEIFKTDDLFSFFFPAYNQFGAVDGGQPSFDWGAINPANTFLEEITLQNGAYDTGWYDGVGGMVSLHDPIGMSSNNFITNITGLEYDVITGRSAPVTSLDIPPVWPGIANVTLGTPVAITPQMTVSGPMDGLIVTITGVTTSKPALNYDTQLAYKFIGALAFVDDNGDVEPFQALAFTNALYCPTKMKLATSAVLRVDPGVAGTVTPWVTI